MVILLQFIFGLAFLVIGAELLVRSASAIALSFGIAPVVIGLTVVAVGTSSPELAISITSALEGKGEIALGNVVGSNIANVLLILGLSAVIVPLAVNRQLVRLDVPIMIGVSFVVVAIAYGVGSFGRITGALLLVGFCVYVFVLLRLSRRQIAEARAAGAASAALEAETEAHEAEGLPTGRDKPRPLWVHGLILIAGLGVMIFGSNWLVDSASEIARRLGLSELVIGLTIVAVGTSAPELATSLVAALRGQRDIAVGNVVGSNIANLLLVLGATALVSPLPVLVPAPALALDLPFMLAVAIACLPIFLTGYAVKRWEGILFVGYYVAYVVYLLLQATEHDALPRYSAILAGFVVPLTVAALGVSVFLHFREQQRARRTVAGTLPAG
jgi:cation:H+ antiporter